MKIDFVRVGFSVVTEK